MTEPSNLQPGQSAPADGELNPLDLLILLAKYKLILLGLPFLAAVIAAGYSFTLPNIYTADTKMVQSEDRSPASAIMAQFGSVAGLIGGESANDKTVYVAMLKSRSMADRLNERFGLMKRWKIDSKYPSLIYEELAKITRISYSKTDGITSIDVDAEEPKFAADLANAYVDELMKMTSVIAVTEASRRRLFFEQQLALAKDNLAKAEIAARQAMQTDGLVKVDDQARAIIETTGRLRGQITAKEVQIGAIRTYAADGNPDLQLALQELASMKRELAKIEGTAGAKAASNGPNGQGMDSIRLLRDVKYRETIFDQLARQYELARLDEAKQPSVIQVMDKAIVPDRRSQPKRKVIVVLGALLGLFISIVWIFFRETVDRVKADPQQASRLLGLRQHLRSWK